MTRARCSFREDTCSSPLSYVVLDPWGLAGLLKVWGAAPEGFRYWFKIRRLFAEASILCVAKPSLFCMCTMPIFRLRSGASGPAIINFSGHDGPRLQQKPLEKVGGEAPYHFQQVLQ